jgi:hypothetical protein
MLHKQGTSMRDILAIKKQNQKIRRVRAKSIQSVKWDGVDEALESASRKVKKVVTKSFWMLSKPINRDAPYTSNLEKRIK